MVITLVIPVYNVEPYIADCLQSVMRQTYTGPLECILVDDCGTDNSIAVAEKLIAEYDGPIGFKVLHHDHNRGLSAARNTGMDAAKGDYVYFLDSDDWISDDCIEKLTAPLQDGDLDIVVGGFVTVGGPQIVLPKTLDEGKYYETGITRTFCNYGVYVMAVNKLYRKEFMLKNQLSFEEGKIHEDEILAFELCCIDKSFYVIKSDTYFYRIRDNSIMTGNSDKFQKIANCFGILYGIKERMKKYENRQGLFDFYMFWIRKVFGMVEEVEMDKELLCYADKESKGFIDVIPNVCYLHNKHDRLAYFSCRRVGTYSSFQYVTKIYANKIQGRILRNILNVLPDRE